MKLWVYWAYWVWPLTFSRHACKRMIHIEVMMPWRHEAIRGFFLAFLTLQGIQRRPLDIVHTQKTFRPSSKGLGYWKGTVYSGRSASICKKVQTSNGILPLLWVLIIAVWERQSVLNNVFFFLFEAHHCQSPGWLVFDEEFYVSFSLFKHNIYCNNLSIF